MSGMADSFKILVFGQPAWRECIVRGIPERTVLYGVVFHYFDRFLTEYESRFEKEYGFLRPIIKEVVQPYLGGGETKTASASRITSETSDLSDPKGWIPDVSEDSDVI